MKFSIATLILFSCFGSSYAFHISVEDEVAMPSPAYRKAVSPNANGGTPDYSSYDYWSMPTEAVLTAKLDSQEVQINLLFDALDSMNRVQVKQISSIKRLKRSNLENKSAIKDENQKREEQSQRSTWIIALLGLTTAIGAFFAFQLFMAKRKLKAE